MKKIRFALIGAGKMGTRWAHVIDGSNDASLDIVADMGSGKATELAKQFPNCRPITDVNAVINDKNIDAVLVVTTHKHLAPISAAALRAGKHVLCEKPAAINPNDIKKNIALAKARKLKYMVGYNHRFHDGFIKARQLYEKGSIGQVIFIRARYGFGGRPGYNKEWRLNKNESGGGHLLDQGVHMIDLAMSFLGEIKQVRGVRSDTFWKKGVEDNAFVLLEDKNKKIAYIHASLTQWKSLHNFEIYGTKGYLAVEGLGKKYGDGEKLVVGKRSADFTGDVKEKVVVCNSDADNSLRLELKEFVSAIKQNRQPNPDPKKAYEVLKIVKQVYKDNPL